MLTSDERREVAARLRSEAECMHSDAINDLLDHIDAANKAMGTCKAAILHLADLIDPTCEVDYRRYLYGSCAYEYRLSCGHSVYRPQKTPPAYCPECGARCIRDGDGHAGGDGDEG